MLIASRAVRSRPFLSRGVVAITGMVVLGLGVYVGLGYAVREPRPWVEKILGDVRCYYLRLAYARTLGGAFPHDSDGDGFPDSVESYFGTSATKASEHLPTNIVTRDWATVSLADGQNSDVLPSYVMEPGDRRRVRGHLCWNGERAIFSPGMKMRLSMGAGVPLNWPEVVPVARDGSFELDLEVPRETAETLSNFGDMLSTWIVAAHPVSGEQRVMLIVDIVQKLPSIPCSVEKVAMDDDMRFQMNHEMRKGMKISAVRLRWPQVEKARVLYIEAMDEGTAGSDKAEEWFPIAVHLPESTTYLIAYYYHGVRKGAEGRLRFRVVPVK